MAMVLRQSRLRLTQAIFFGDPVVSGTGSVTSVGSGVGITTIPNPITGAGTVNLQVPVTYAHGGTNAITAWTPGSVIFAGPTAYAQDNTQLFYDDTNNRVGIGTGVPSVALDVNGAYATRAITILTITNGLNSDIVLPQSSFVRLAGPTGAFGVGGFTGGTDGRQLTIFNTTTEVMTLVDEDLLSTAANRIKTLTGGDVTLALAAGSAATFTYDSTLQRWIYQEAAAIASGYLLADGSIPLTADWNASAGETANPHSIQSRNSTNWFNILAYGADPTNTVDSTAAVQAAINAATVGGMTGVNGTIYVPTGNYKILSTLTVTAPCAFRGDNTGASQFILPNASDGIQITTITPTQLTVSFYDMRFSCTAATAGAMIHTNSAGSFPLYVQNCYFNGHFIGIQMNTNWAASILNNQFNTVTVNSQDIFINNTINPDYSDYFISGNQFWSSGSYNIHLTGAGGVHITGNKFIGTTVTYSILADTALGTTTDDLFIQGNSIEGDNATASIALLPSGLMRYTMISDNEIVTVNGGPGILIAPTATGQAIIGQIHDNIIGSVGSVTTVCVDINPGAAGGLDNWSIRDNTFELPQTAAIRLPGTPARATNLKVGRNQYAQSGTVPYVSGAFSSSSGFDPGIETVFVQTASSTTTANTLTTLFGTGHGSLTIPAGRLMAGTRVRIKAQGYVSQTDGGATAHIDTLSLGGVTVVTNTGGAQTYASGNPWVLDASLTCRSTGGVGTVIGWYFLNVPGIGSNYAAASAVVNVNTGLALAIDFKHNNQNAAGTLTTTECTVEILDAKGST